MDQPRVYIKAAKCQETVHSVSTSRALIVRVDTNDAFYEFRFSHVAKRNRAYVFFREFCDIDQTVELLTAKWEKENCGKDVTSALPFDVIFLLSKYLPFSDMMSLMHVSVQFWKGISTSDDIRQLFIKKCISPHQGILKKNWILDLDHISKQPFTYKFSRCFPLDPVVNFHVKEDSRHTYCIDIPLWSGKYYYELVMHDWKRVANRNNFNFSFGWNGCKSRLLGNQLGNTTECSLTTAEIPIYSNMNWVYQHKMYRGFNIVPQPGTSSFWRDGNSKNTFVPIPAPVLATIPARDTMCFGTTIDLDNGVLQYYCNGVCLDTITCLLSDTECNKERTARQILPIIPTFYVENCQIDFLFSSTNVYNTYEGYTPIGDLCPNQTLFYFHKEIKETIYASKKEKEKAKAKERERERLRILEKERNEQANNDILSLPTPSSVTFGDLRTKEELERQIEVARNAVQKTNENEQEKREKKKEQHLLTALSPAMSFQKDADMSASFEEEGEEESARQIDCENIAANLSKKSPQKSAPKNPSPLFANAAEQRKLVNNQIVAMSEAKQPDSTVKAATQKVAWPPPEFAAPPTPTTLSSFSPFGLAEAIPKTEAKEAKEAASTPKPPVQPSAFPVFDFEDPAPSTTATTFAPLPNSAFAFFGPSSASSSSESKSLSASGSLSASSAVSPARKPGTLSSSAALDSFQFGFESPPSRAPSTSFQFGGRPNSPSGFGVAFGFNDPSASASPAKTNEAQPAFSFGSPSFNSPSSPSFQFGQSNNSTTDAFAAFRK